MYHNIYFFIFSFYIFYDFILGITDLGIVKRLDRNVELKRQWYEFALTLGIPEADLVELEGQHAPSSMERLNRVGTHYSYAILSAMASHITGVSIVCSTVGSGADQRKHQSSATLAFGWGIHRWPVNSPHKGLVTRKMFPFDGITMARDFNHYKRHSIHNRTFCSTTCSGWQQKEHKS